MKTYLSLGSTPCDEPCSQTADADYMEQNRIECSVYIEQLIRSFPPVEGAYYSRISEPHDFGPYYEVAIKYHDDKEKEEEFAFFVENNQPEKWDNISLARLKELGYNLNRIK